MIRKSLITVILFVLIGSLSILLHGCSDYKSKVDGNLDTSLTTTKTTAVSTSSNSNIITQIPEPILRIIGQHINKKYKSLTEEDIKNIDSLYLYRDSFISNGDNPDMEYDLSFLPELHNLAHFASEVRLKDYSVLERCYHLISLALSRINDEDASKLADRLDNLLELSIGSSNLSSLDFIEKHDKVSYLSISNMPDFPIVDVLNSSMFLNKVYAPNLSLSRMNLKGEDIGLIKKFKSVHRLYLNDNDIGQISNFPDALNLETLDLSGNPVVCINIPIEKVPNLKTLILRDTNIEDLTKLQGLDNLAEINLTNTKVTNIAPLKKFKNLKLIEIDPDKVKGVDVFDGTEVQIRKEF